MWIPLTRISSRLVPPGQKSSLSPSCESKDFDHDLDVDQSDFAVFQRCYSGENVPADPNGGEP